MKTARRLAYVALISLAGCQSNHSSLSPAGPQAESIEWLYWLIFWICLVVFVLVMVLFGGASARSRIDQAEMAPVLHESETEPADRVAKFVVSAAVVVTVITLFVVLALSVVTGKSVSGLESKNPQSIEVIGHQWWWEARYPNPQADLTVVTANEIHIPVGTPITVLTGSRDVIHSFWAPNLNGKRDLLPGYQTAFTFEVNNPGIYHGQCAEYCGEQHAHMGFEIVAEPIDKFQAWLEAQRKPSLQPEDPTALRGREVFLTHACVLCHTIRGTDAGSKVGPDLTHLATRRMIAATTLINAPGSLAGWITDPQRIKPGVRMPANPLAPDDLQALVTYLRSLQ